MPFVVLGVKLKLRSKRGWKQRQPKTTWWEFKTKKKDQEGWHPCSNFQYYWSTTNISPQLVCILRMTLQGDRTGQLPKWLSVFQIGDIWDCLSNITLHYAMSRYYPWTIKYHNHFTYIWVNLKTFNLFLEFTIFIFQKANDFLQQESAFSS